MFSSLDILQKNYPQVADRAWLCNTLKFFLGYLLHEKECVEFGQLYPHLQEMEFVEQVLEYFDFSYSVRDKEKENIPSRGRVVIVANHPIGSLDGLALLKLISEVRRDVKVVANQMLMEVEPIQPLLLPVNNMQGGTVKKCISSIQGHLANEGALIIFPAGEVSRLSPHGVRDGHWNSGFLKIAKSAKAPILPVFMDGKNSPLFYGLSMLYKPFGSMLLVKEMFKQRAKHLPVRIGEVIPFESYSALKIPRKQQVKLFKKHLYRIAENRSGIFQTQKAIALPEDRKALSQGIKSECELLGTTFDKKGIYLYRHKGSSPILREIGRLREVSFRTVGEGSNRRRDIDRYDSDYFHLILWDYDDLEIVGAYRLGDAKRLVESRDTHGLYTSTLFDFSPAMGRYFEQGLELGRSFVQPQYWGKRSLDYLWYGIGALLVRYPQYRYMFGPVSISGAYPKSAQDVLVEFYRLYFGGQPGLVESKSPYVPSNEWSSLFAGGDYQSDFVVLKDLLANMGLSVPVLYKQYSSVCEQGGVQFLSFGVDQDFNGCIDGFVLVDTYKLTDKKRSRYMSAAVDEVDRAP